MLPQNGARFSEELQLLQHSSMKFDCSNKLDLCCYGQVNLLWLKSSVSSKWASEQLWSNIYFAGNCTTIIFDILLLLFAIRVPTFKICFFVFYFDCLFFFLLIKICL